MEGWPTNINNVPDSARDYWKVRDQLHVADGLIFVGERLVVPTTIVLQGIHEGHMRIKRCKQRGRSCVYWPSMNDNIEMRIKECEICNKFPTTNRKEPMIAHKTPSRPWEKLGVDYFTLLNQDYSITSLSHSNAFQDCPSHCQSNDVSIFKTWNTKQYHSR